MLFEDFDLSDDLLDALYAMHFEECTPIQEQAIPVVLDRRDLIAIAQTGTGKTAAYLLPVIDLLAELPEADGFVNCIVMAPTRELAQQIERQMDGFSYYLPLSSIAVYGGTDGAGFARQQKGMKAGADVVIATPGRLQALLQMGGIDLSKVKYFVLDEADRMLDMGFIADIRRLLPMLPAERQTLFFSATMPKDIVALSGSILHDPARVEVTPVSSTVDTVDQRIYFVEKPEKKGLLISLLKQESDKSVLVFSRTKHGADSISRILKKAGIRSEAIHGNKSQGQRQRALGDFKSGKIQVMVATDIAARGIDINELNMVINYDLPDVAETYVHRIGRTGRAGRSGTALSFCSKDEHVMVKDIQKLTGRKLATVQYTA